MVNTEVINSKFAVKHVTNCGHINCINVDFDAPIKVQFNKVFTDLQMLRFGKIILTHP